MAHAPKKFKCKHYRHKPSQKSYIQICSKVQKRREADQAADRVQGLQTPFQSRTADQSCTLAKARKPIMIRHALAECGVRTCCYEGFVSD